MSTPTNEDDHLIGTDNPDVIDGLKGNDIIEGFGGDDVFLGNEGNDILYGDGGNDTLDGGLDNDELWGGADNDQLTGGVGMDLLEGEQGNDTLDGGAGNDRLFGGIGDDVLNGAEDDDEVYAGDGNDIARGGNGMDVVFGGSGDDTLSGGADGDLVEGGDGADVIDGDDGKDTLYGGLGNDILRGGEDSDQMFGGDGDDVVRSGNGDDTGFGGDGNDRMFGDDGNDTLNGQNGDDVLNGGLGQDTLDGGDGHDLLDISAATSELVVTLSATGNGFVIATGIDTDIFFNFESISSGSGDDQITGNRVANSLLGGGGNDVLHGRGFNDSLSGGIGNDTLIGDDAVLPTAAADSIYRLYLATLSRGPDPDGHANWTAVLDGGTSLTSVASGFVNSAEFQQTYGTLDNTQFVTLLYNNVLHRAPDNGGLGNWVASLNGGASRESVVVGFSESAEFKISSDTTDDFGQVYRLYGAAFDRNPDAAGFEGWIDSLHNGMTLSTAAASFVGSAEFIQTYGPALTNTEFVTLMYNNVLNRAPDSGGLASWVSLLEAGTSRANILTGFSESTEFQSDTNSALASFMRTGLPTWADSINGGSGDDLLAGNRGSDTFVFQKAESGADHIYGFEAWDNVQLTGFGYVDPVAAQSHLSVSGGDVVFADQGQTITFHDTSLQTVQSAIWLL